jgi:phosphatidylserine/phosphatidylglycerophosphate/cardiolipin synthase-like enzyme
MGAPVIRASLSVICLLLLTLAACETEDSGGGRPGSPRADAGASDVALDAADVAAPEDVVSDADATSDAPDEVAPPDVEEDTAPPPPVRFITDEGAFTELELLIKGAKDTVDLAHFEANDDDSAVDQVLTWLDKLQSFGREVRFLVDDEIEGNQAAIDTLVEAGVDAKDDDAKRRLHVKLSIADGARVLVGSTNLSGTSFFYSHEANLLIDDPSLAQALQGYFDALWQDAGPLLELPAVTSQGTRVVFDRAVYDKLKQDIKGAKERILAVFYVVSAETQEIRALMDELGDASDRGCEVEMILEKSDWSQDINNINGYAASELRSRGVVVRWDDVDHQTHAKLMIIDDSVHVLTSNLSYASLLDDHAIGLRTTLASVLADALAYYDLIRATSSPVN